MRIEVWLNKGRSQQGRNTQQLYVTGWLSAFVPPSFILITAECQFFKSELFMQTYKLKKVLAVLQCRASDCYEDCEVDRLVQACSSARGSSSLPFPLLLPHLMAALYEVVSQMRILIPQFDHSGGVVCFLLFVVAISPISE